MRSGEPAELTAQPAPTVDTGSPLAVVLPHDQQPERLDKVLAVCFPELTRETLKRWILEGRVLVDGVVARRPRDQVRAGVRIQLSPGPRPASSALPETDVRLVVVFEDEFLLVIDKPAGLVVHPGRGHHTGTLVNGLLARPGFERPPSDPLDQEGHLRPGIVHRIDRDTSGLLVVAKTEAAREGLKRQLAEHSVERSYLALTVGLPRAGRIETLHGRDPRSRLRFSSLVSTGRQAVTKLTVLESLGGGRAAFIRAELETGRTHQIRVHLSQKCRTPILADELYGGARAAPEILVIASALGRQALHAAVLGFVHPVTGEPHRFELPLPEDMQLALQSLRAAG